MFRSISRWLSKPFQGTTANKQGRSDAPGSHLAKDVPTKPPTTAKSTEFGLIDTPPPSYENVCPGPVEAVIGAVTDAQPVTQDSKSLRPVDGVKHRVDDELRRLKVPNADGVSSGILQLCCFAAYRVSENHRGNSNVRADERRQTNHREIDKIFSLVLKPVTAECLVEVINMTANVFEEVAVQVMAERKDSHNKQVKAEFHFMKSSIYRVAVRVCTQLAGDKTLPTSTFAGLVFAANCYNGAADGCIGAAEACLR
ncbi:hypothetical protein PG991_007246 [Apiospora marii]|uniref:Uncharacterized protein n=1 Tax=Apiospora marii TaxID=335849 RepID=A0ABR1RSW5_9PEZI